jgi:hypothetical protein
MTAETLQNIAIYSGICFLIVLVASGLYFRATKQIPKPLLILVLLFVALFLSATFTVAITEFQKTLILNEPETEE